MDVSTIVTLLLAAIAVTLSALVIRRLRLLRSGGIHVAVRNRIDDTGKGWQLGVGRYQGDEFAWFRALSLRAGPDRIIHRAGLEISDRRDPDGAETPNMPVGSRVLRFRVVTDETGPVAQGFEMAMAQDALTGFLSWLESAPPGRRMPRAS